MATIKKKRTGLDTLGLGATTSTDTFVKTTEKISDAPRSAKSLSTEKLQEKIREKEEPAKTTVYAPKVVFEQWRELAFTERKKMHDYLLEGLDRVFKDRGLKSIAELTGKNE